MKPSELFNACWLAWKDEGGYYAPWPDDDQTDVEALASLILSHLEEVEKAETPLTVGRESFWAEDADAILRSALKLKEARDE